MGFNGGKRGDGYGRHDARDYYESDYSNRSASSTWSDSPKNVRSNEPWAATPAASPPKALLKLEKKLSGIQTEFVEELQRIGEAETEKFDLIFSILTDLQLGQAQLEESIEDIKKHAANVQNMPQFSGGNGGTNFQCFGQMVGTMGTQTSSNGGGQPPMQQILVQPNSTQAMFIAVPQMMMMQSPTGGMVAPQMQPMQTMQPMQPMQQQMVQFVGQGTAIQETGSVGDSQSATAEPCLEGNDGKVSLPSEASKHEGSDVDSTDTPTTGISEWDGVPAPAGVSRAYP